MTRLHIIAEGQTEEGFVNRVLVEHLAQFGVYARARCVETSRSRRHGTVFRGGLLNYRKAKNDLLRWMKQDQNLDAHFTTMFDLYRLPSDFPGHDDASAIADPLERVRAIETALASDLAHPRFIPYIQLHEFEALLLADPSKFESVFLENAKGIRQLEKMVNAFSSPELIDDGDHTSPSKRIAQEIPAYARQKVSAAPVIAEKIGLASIREKCRHFHDWLANLEGLSSAVSKP